MDSSFVRKLSGLEAFFTDLDAGGANMTIHFYLELTRKPDVDRLRDAMNQILSENSGMDMRFYKNAWHATSCYHECPVIDVYGRDLSSYTPSRLDFNKSTIDLKILHATESDTWYLCFDFFHGVMDGRSAVSFVYDFFDVLNGREYLKPEFKLGAYDLLKNAEKKKKSRRIRNEFTVASKCAPSDWKTKKEGEDKTVVISHDHTVRGIAAHHSNAVRKLFKKSAKMVVPVDVRRHADVNDRCLYGNLFVPMLIDTARYPSCEETRDELWRFVTDTAHIRSVEKKFNIYRRFATGLRRFVIRKAIPYVMSRKKFIYSALVSSLGSIDSTRLRCEDFAVKDCSMSIASFPFTAFTVVSLHFEGQTRTSISWHSGRVSDGTVNALIDGINECMLHAEPIESQP